ncbi:MAG: hypothetical protein OEZ06_14840 [Myxococcales bacterium]|nr:hypothetical protein [Myxococcales bacterium]
MMIADLKLQLDQLTQNQRALGDDLRHSRRQTARLQHERDALEQRCAMLEAQHSRPFDSDLQRQLERERERSRRLMGEREQLLREREQGQDRARQAEALVQLLTTRLQEAEEAREEATAQLQAATEAMAEVRSYLSSSLGAQAPLRHAM